MNFTWKCCYDRNHSMNHKWYAHDKNNDVTAIVLMNRLTFHTHVFMKESWMASYQMVQDQNPWPKPITSFTISKSYMTLPNTIYHLEIFVFCCDYQITYTYLYRQIVSWLLSYHTTCFRNTRKFVFADDILLSNSWGGTAGFAYQSSDSIGEWMRWSMSEGKWFRERKP